MANLGKFEIDTNGQWVTLAEITELTFTAGERYNLQLNKGGLCAFCEKSSTPEENEGFIYFGTELEPIPYLVEDAPLYVKNLSNECTINIAIKE